MFKNFKLFFIGLTGLAFLVGCNGNSPATPHSKAAKNTGERTVYVDAKASYDSKVPRNIRKECHINTQVVKFTKSYAKKHHINVIVNGKHRADATVLKLRITNAVSERKFGYGTHNKYVVLSGKLYKSGKLHASFRAARKSNGGYFGGYRSSCSVLGSCAKSLGRDTAEWLTHPVNHAKLGDTYLIK
ncbi:hypothetical protein MNB_SV-8-342 [hydrothermal vent metagenome]|uniref:Lipoprotein n=1 Tax=hydrothermal vent metagenome TaxID=652676 RepID=A0A1W1BPL4_9ZZZZ